VTALGVVVACRHELVQGLRGESARRTIDLVLISPDGEADPVSMGSPGMTGGEP